MLIGRVIYEASGGPFPGVPVSNGRDVVLTDGDGHYRLPEPTQATHGERFVMVTTPSGYRPVGGWFRDLRTEPEADLTFRLARDGNRSGETFRFAQITDMHIGMYPGEWLTADLRAIAETGDRSHRPVQCIVATGDVTWAGKPEEFADYMRACGDCPIPIIHVPGNHDSGTDESGETWAGMVGPLYFSLDWGPVHLIAYESTANCYVPEMPVEAWCAADLALVPPDKPIVMLIHDQFGEEFYRRWRHRRIVATLSGHWHSSRLYDDGHTLHFNGPTTHMGGIDYSARGYSVFTVDSAGKVESSRHLLGTRKRAWRTGIASVPEPPPTEPGPAAPEVRLGSPWPQFHGGPHRNGLSADGPEPPYFRRWQTRLPGGLLFGSPVIAGDSVFIAALDEERHDGAALVALDAHTGAVHWQQPTGASVKHTPAIWRDLVIVVTVTGNVIAADRATGETIWRYQLGDPSERWIFSAPLVVGDRVFAGHARHFVALDARTGERIWLRDDLQVRVRNDWISSYSSPAADERNVYVGFFWHGESVWALDQQTGETQWLEDGGKGDCGPVSTPVLDGGGLYVVTHDARLRAYVASTGERPWEFDLERKPGQRGGAAWSAGTPAFAPGSNGGFLYVPTGDGVVRAIRAATGEEVWQWWCEESLAGIQAYSRDGKSILSSPVVVGGYLVLGTGDGRIVALDRSSGALVWSDDIGAPVVSSPGVSGNLLVCGASDGWLYAWTGGAPQGGRRAAFPRHSPRQS